MLTRSPVSTGQVEADLDLGLQAINTSVTRTITLRNSGHTEAEFKIEPVVPGLDIKVRKFAQGAGA